MFEKIGRVAETMATRASLSRRRFLDRLGQGALAAVGLLGSAFVLSRDARASSSGLYCCRYESCYLRGRSRGFIYRCYSGFCPPLVGGYFCSSKLNGKKQVSDCTQCP
jgi:hypothetical protein